METYTKARLGAAIFLVWITSILPAAAQALQKVTFDFHGRQISLPYDPATTPACSGFSQETPRIFLESMSAAVYKPLINALLEKRSSLQLNDWLYYSLVKEASRQMHPTATPVCRTLMEWFILIKSGYRVRLMHDFKKPYIFVLTLDELLEIPFFMKEEGRYANITAINTPEAKKLQKLVSTNLGFDPRGRIFQFSFTVRPAIIDTVETMEKTLRFAHDGRTYSLPVSGDKSYIAFLRAYPKLEISHLPAMPVSDRAYRSVIPRFREWTAGMSEADAVRFILSFTRSAFAYDTDRDAYSEESLAFSPELTLLSPFSDCEDRAILFAWMIKEVLKKKVVLVEFPSHVAAAVNLDENHGTPIVFEGSEYSFCEATGPQNELGLGECHQRYLDVRYKVVGLE